ncbi:MAG TPA: FAD-dependent oxidoreductase [Egibacteraceae bacterium]|nr:FAD-dependent oxidoreductase [Egibacteraceae bacterium]
MPDVDVIVVGAGLAGLRAADLLRARGLTTLVLEARDRVGGRTWTTELAGAPVELGAQWVGPGQPRILALLDELGLATHHVAHDGRKVVAAGGRVRTYSGTVPPLSPTALAGLQGALWAMDRLARTVDPAAPWDARRAAELDGRTLEQWKRRHIPPGSGRSVFDAAIRVVFGAEPGELSLLWAAHYVAGGGGMEALVEVQGGAQERRISAGTQALALALSARLGDAVRLSHPVERVVQDAGGVTVTGPWGQARAGRLVVALPPHLAGRIAFAPLLPVARDALTQRFPMGQTIKVQVRYERAFWRARGLSGEAVLADGPVSVVIDGSGAEGAAPGLSAFVVAEPGRQASRWTPETRRERVLDQLARCFGDEAREPLGYADLDWAAQEWSRGCPTGSAVPGALSRLGPALREACGRVHWAGTETARQWAGYMEGALESAERVAAEVGAAR